MGYAMKQIYAVNDQYYYTRPAPQALGKGSTLLQDPNLKVREECMTHARPYPPDGQAREWWHVRSQARSGSRLRISYLRSTFGPARCPSGGSS